MKFKRIILQRTPCYGPCPVYECAVAGDGTVDWDGQHFVAVEGKSTWTVSPSRVGELERALDKTRFYSMQEANEEICRVTDVADCHISVEFEDGSIKRLSESTVESSSFDRFRWLATRIDKLVGADKYVELG